jgi:hypothetical protein
VAAYLGRLAAAGTPSRTLAPGHWGLTLEAAGWPLHLGVAIREGVLRAQAEALGPDAVDPHELLHRNRRLRLVRYTHAGDGTVWVEADLPEEAVTEALVDRMLGAVVAAAAGIRERARVA